MQTRRVRPCCISSVSPAPGRTQNLEAERQADNMAAIRAEQAWRITRERRVFALSGEWVGRIEDVRDSPADGGLTGILRVRRRYGGRVALPWADSSRPTASSWPQRQPRSLKRRETDRSRPEEVAPCASFARSGKRAKIGSYG